HLLHPPSPAAFRAARACLDSHLQKQATLLRHIIGNPFRPYPVPDCWPSAVVQLAEAMYTGADCGFALHDALLEAGHAELAGHFRHEAEHPKGCWAVDLILGKSSHWNSDTGVARIL